LFDQQGDGENALSPLFIGRGRENFTSARKGMDPSCFMRFQQGSRQEIYMETGPGFMKNTFSTGFLQVASFLF
jgi:hypothetical protein